MFTLWRDILAVCRMAKIARLIELSNKTDEILITCRLAPATREMLQQRRDELEREIQVLRAS
jgi:hypothetical protein